MPIKKAGKRPLTRAHSPMDSLPSGLSTHTSPFPDGFDEEYCRKTVQRIGEGIFHSYRSIQFPEKNKELITGLGSQSLYYASLHKSHFDYIALCYTLFTEGLPYPRSVSGRNLVKGPIAAIMQKRTKINMLKWGAIPLERGGSVSRNLAALCRHLEGILKSGRPVMSFPEMGTVEHHGKNFVKTGRSYTGQARPFAPGLFGPAIQAARAGKNVYVIPISVAYDFIAEDRYFQSLSRSEGLKHLERLIPRLLGRMYYLFLEFSFFSKVYNLGQGNIYIDFGRPIRVDPTVSKKELSQRAFEEAVQSYRVTMPALISYFIHQGITNQSDLTSAVEIGAAKLSASKINFQMLSDVKNAVSQAITDMTKRGLIAGSTDLMVLKPDIIRYYANTVAHHLD